MVAMDFFAALNSYDFFNQYCSNFAEKSDGERVKFHPMQNIKKPGVWAEIYLPDCNFQ